MTTFGQFYKAGSLICLTFVVHDMRVFDEVGLLMGAFGQLNL